MNTKKVAITIPISLVALIDQTAKLKGMSRSKFISTVLENQLLKERNEKIREAYDHVFSDPAIRREQLETANWFDGAGSLEGQEW